MPADTEHRIGGMRVVLNDCSSPKMQLSEDCPVTSAFREEMNKWMVDFFGSTPLIPDGQVMHGLGFFYMNSKTFYALKSNATSLDSL